MSAEEMREFCKSIQAFKLRVQVRLKNGAEIMVGTLDGVETDGFKLVTSDKGVQSLRYAWVARISHN